MLTQGLPPDPKYKLIISFLTLPHLLDCLICTRNAIVLLLQMRGNGKGRGWLIYIRVWMGGQAMAIILQFLFFSCAFIFCCLTF